MISSNMKLSQVFVFLLILISSLRVRCAHSRQNFTYTKYELPPGVSGPESTAFDCNGDGPYTGTSDGRIFKWENSTGGWKEFATTSPLR